VVPGSAQRSKSLVDIPTSLSAELNLLSEVLDSPPSDISVSLSDLVAELTGSVESFVGLSVLVGDLDDPVEITTIQDETLVGRIRTSLRFPLPSRGPTGRVERPSGVLIVYAALPGALVDLAADLAWLSGRPLDEARLDEDLGGPRAKGSPGPLSQLSTVTQAVGVLMAGGLTPEEASAELDARAVDSGVERHRAAVELLESLLECDLGPDDDGPGGERDQ
jgi:hypothetical protein